MYSPLLSQFIEQINLCAQKGRVLDLACGTGRNGLYLVQNNIETVFADKNSEALATVKLKLQSQGSKQSLAHYYQGDFEIAGQIPAVLVEQQFGVILIFRYLHRALFEPIKQAIAPGGLIIYETFNCDQAQLGRPKNPDFLLKHGELSEVFSGWDILHSFEGQVSAQNDVDGKTQAIAQIVARKPKNLQ